MSRRDLTEVLGLRLTDADLAKLATVADELGLPRPELARRALRLGLAAIEADPALFMSPDARTPSKRSKRRKKR